MVKYGSNYLQCYYLFPMYVGKFINTLVMQSHIFPFPRAKMTLSWNNGGNVLVLFIVVDYVWFVTFSFSFLPNIRRKVGFFDLTMLRRVCNKVGDKRNFKIGRAQNYGPKELTLGFGSMT